MCFMFVNQGRYLYHERAPGLNPGGIFIPRWRISASEGEKGGDGGAVDSETLITRGFIC